MALARDSGLYRWDDNSSLKKERYDVFDEKTEGRKSRDTVPLSSCYLFSLSCHPKHNLLQIYLPSLSSRYRRD
jgi:hypothetical protein